MIFIIHSKKYGPHKVEIDDEDWEKIRDFKWNVNYKRAKIESVQSTTRIGGKKSTILLHRLIISDTIMIDHVDGNPLNNKKNNLRPCNNAQNCRNRNKTKNNTSGYKGVTYLRQKNKTTTNEYIVARIYTNNKKIHLGLFPTVEAAALAYNKAAKKYFGEFARLNKV